MSQENPWKAYASKKIYENPWIKVREDQVIRPDGKQGIYGVVETRIATGIVALSESNEIYLVGQYRYPVNEYTWEIIEGGTDPGEDPLVTAKRELKEEAGLIAEQWSPIGGELQLSNCFSSEIGFLYLAQNLTQVESEPEGTEILTIKKVAFSEAVRMVEANEIKDALSIIAILRVERLLSGRK